MVDNQGHCRLPRLIAMEIFRPAEALLPHLATHPVTMLAALRIGSICRGYPGAWRSPDLFMARYEAPALAIYAVRLSADECSGDIVA